MAGMMVRKLQFAAFQRPATFGRENEAFAATRERLAAPRQAAQTALPAAALVGAAPFARADGLCYRTPDWPKLCLTGMSGRADSNSVHS